MYKDKQILGCISDAKYAAYDNTGTGLSATNAQDAITELNGKLENAKVLIDTITTDGSGNAYLGNYVAVFGVSTNTNDTKIEVFKNTLGMFYAHVNNVAGDNYPGTFQFYIWGIKNVS